jgi:hypothetical protein
MAYYPGWPDLHFAAAWLSRRQPFQSGGKRYLQALTALGGLRKSFKIRE